MASSDAGTSSGSEYQVFLSFRGPDTREGFTDFLFQSLTDNGIYVFLDDEELRVGERISESLRRAIDNSSIYIPIFSRNYASSQWCLRELEQIVANTSNSKHNKEILPIFFDVEPEDVKLKTALYSEAILSLQLEKKLSNEEVDAWREALKKVDEIKGWEVKKYNGHGKLIQLVVDVVVTKLKTKHRREPEHLVGIEDRVLKIRELFDVDSGGVRFIQIHGMGGIGKTTLAKVIFNQLFSHFGKCCCFLDDVRAKSSTVGLVGLQKKLLSEIGVHGGTRSIDEIDYGMKRIGEVLSNKKVLIVLDDVDNNEQVEYLVGKSSLCSGSRILITTRNKEVLHIHRPEYQMLEYEMEEMHCDHALQLFSKHAFGSNSPSYDYSDLSREIVSFTGRLPLALEVIGSLLYHKRQDEWKETLKELRKIPHTDVIEKLKISYDALTFEQRQIFLDIACFFINKNKANAIYFWEDCGLLPKNGVNVLNSRCLIKIDNNGWFWMHDQLRDFGREVVRQENQMNPEERSRLWNYEEILDAITTKEVKKNVLALDLDLHKSNPKVVVESEEIGRFQNLRYLKLNGGTFVGDLANRLTRLRWLFWSHPPQTSKPTNMHFKNVVVLQFSDNYFIDDSTLRSSIKIARKLKVLSLENCGHITRAPDFCGCPNLERLTFKYCCNLRNIDGSIGKLKCLTDLTIYSCSCLEDLPEEIGELVNLKRFDVKECKVKKLPDSIWKLKSLREVFFSSTYIPDLDGLDSGNSWELPSAIGMLQNLEVLLVKSRCLRGQLPSAIGSLPSLRILILRSTGVSEVPRTVSMLPRLQILELDCNIQELPALPTSLTTLKVLSNWLQVIPNLSNLTNLVQLNLSDGFHWRICAVEVEWIGNLYKPNKFSLRLLNIPVTQLPRSLLKLQPKFFNSVFPSFILANLSSLELSHNDVQEIQLNVPQLQNLTELVLQECSALERFTLANMRKLKSVRVIYCPKLVEIQFAGLLESLEECRIQMCESLGSLAYTGEVESATESISQEGRLILLSRASNKLQVLELSSCRIHEIQVVGTWESLEHLRLWDCPHVESIWGSSDLKNLKTLSLAKRNELQVIGGFDKPRFGDWIQVYGWLEKLIDVASIKLPTHCDICISGYKQDFKGSLESYEQHQKASYKQDFKGSLESYEQRQKERERKSNLERVTSDFEQERKLLPLRLRLRTVLTRLKHRGLRRRKRLRRGSGTKSGEGWGTGTRKPLKTGTGIKEDEKAGGSVVPTPELQQFSALHPPPFFYVF